MTILQAGQRLVDDHERLHLLLEQLEKVLREKDSDVRVMKARLMRRRGTCCLVHRRARLMRLPSKSATDRFGPPAERLFRKMKTKPGSAAVFQAQLIMLIMINIAQLWILAARFQ